jgi:hypothetical protein
MNNIRAELSSQSSVNLGVFLVVVVAIIDNKYELPRVLVRFIVDALLVLRRVVFFLPQLLNRADGVLVIHTYHDDETNGLLGQLVDLKSLSS